MKNLLHLIFIAIVAINLQAQELTITGTVTENSGFPLPGVNVIIKSTGIGTQSDFDGNYKLITTVGETLVYSYVGFVSVEKTILKNDSIIDISMYENAEILDEVIVTGYCIQRDKKALGYSVSKVQAKDIENIPESSVVRALNGKVAGVKITGTGGAVGSLSLIHI